MTSTTPPLSATAPLLQSDEFSTLEFALLGVEAVTVLLGFVIAYVAIQGYRRNESRPMLFVATGFVLLVGVPGLLSTVYLAGVLPEPVLAVGSSVSEVLAMASILYGLRQPTRG
jgi:hypothetical protein